VSSIRRMIFLLLVAGLSVSTGARAAAPEYVQEILREAKSKGRSVPGQVRALFELAWPRDEDPDPQVQAEARRSLVLYGHHALPVLRRAIPDLDPLYQADAVSAFIEARYRNPSGMPPDFLPGLEESIWYGSSEAQRVALNEIQRYRFPPAVLSSIDAVYDNPILTRYVVNSFARMNDPRARLFLADLMLTGSDFYKGPAARALKSLGDQTAMGFRRRALSDNKETRETALRIFLPLSETSDLKMLKRYLAERTEDDPDLLEAVQKRVDVLEQRATP